MRFTDSGKTSEATVQTVEPTDSSRVLEILNTGNLKELKKLATIGEQRARQILAYR